MLDLLLMCAAACLPPLPQRPLQSRPIQAVPAWRIPDGGALRYERNGDAASAVPCDKAKDAREAETREPLPGRYLPRLLPAAVVCAGELAADGRKVAGAAADLREALRLLAFDLSADGRVRAELPHVVPFGDVRVEGGWSSPDEGGQQEFVGRWTARSAEPLAGVDRAALARLHAVCVGPSDGTIRIRRTVAAEAGRVERFAADVDLVVEDAGRWRRIVVRESWQFEAVLDGQNADFRRRVADAIRRGTGWVREAVAGGRSYLAERDGEARDFRGGRLALALLTMVHGHIPRDDAALAAGFAELRRRELTDSYSLAAALMAVAARYAPPDEIELLRSGKLQGAASRELSDDDRRAVEQWTARLLANVDPRAPRDVLRFNYEAGPRYDTSLQQYGLLGLWSAHLCGVKLPKGTFAACARQLLFAQGREQGRVPLALGTYAQLRAAELGDPVKAAAARPIAARGFAYQEPAEAAFGSMTSAGVSGLLLARAGMAATGDGDRALASAIDGAIAAGFAWLAEHLSVRRNPGFAERADNHWYYWLYCLERSCELHGIARLQGRDWYYEGALQLLAQQSANGSFRSESPATMTIDATCFAVLFLAKATAPAAITAR